MHGHHFVAGRRHAPARTGRHVDPRHPRARDVPSPSARPHPSGDAGAMPAVRPAQAPGNAIATTPASRFLAPSRKERFRDLPPACCTRSETEFRAPGQAYTWHRRSHWAARGALPQRRSRCASRRMRSRSRRKADGHGARGSPDLARGFLRARDGPAGTPPVLGPDGRLQGTPQQIAAVMFETGFKPPGAQATPAVCMSTRRRAA